MQTEIILAKYGELALKGLNRNTFEDILMKNIKRRLKPLGKFTYTRAQSTIYIEPETPEMDLDVVMDNMKKIFGIAALCKACVCEKDLADISRVGIPYLEETLLGVKTFKVEAKRADKQVSVEIAGNLPRTGRSDFRSLSTFTGRCQASGCHRHGGNSGKACFCTRWQ